MKKKLVKAMMGILVASCMFGTVCQASSKGDTYPETMVIFGASDIGFYAMPFDGYVEYGYYGKGDWKIGDCVSVIMNDNGTTTPVDDYIVKVKKSGWGLSDNSNPMRDKMLAEQERDEAGRLEIELREKNKCKIEGEIKSTISSRKIKKGELK